jgi:hypothetical protein
MVGLHGCAWLKFMPGGMEPRSGYIFVEKWIGHLSNREAVT